jgi:hypothetical protein
MAPAGRRTHHGHMDTLMLLLVPFGALALLCGVGAASAGSKAAAADDAGRRFELWGMCATLTVFAVLLAVAAWWWWSGWSNWSF